MRKILYAISLMVLSSCSFFDNDIKLVCQGIETTSGSNEKGQILKPGSQNVTRTFSISKLKRNVTEGNLTPLQKDGSDKLKSTEKKVWVIKRDSSSEFFEENSLTNFGNDSERIHSNVNVNKDSIYGYNNLSRYRTLSGITEETLINYKVLINRISGEFEEVELEKNPNNSRFMVVTKGTCLKTDRKF